MSLSDSTTTRPEIGSNIRKLSDYDHEFINLKISWPALMKHLSYLERIADKPAKVRAWKERIWSETGKCQVCTFKRCSGYISTVPKKQEAAEPEPEAPVNSLGEADYGLIRQLIKILSFKDLLKAGQYEAIASMVNEAHQEIKARQEGQGGSHE